MPQITTAHTEEHELPSLEAVLAGTLALMTGYGQALQADHDPAQRLRMSRKIVDNLALLVDHPRLSVGFRQVLLGLQDRWQAMRRCTEEAAREIDHDAPRVRADARFQVDAPKQLQ
jgi:plasmid stabilization system protein ParE